jgi:DNA-directed RNA polymerase specialized sigma24 family protein
MPILDNTVISRLAPKARPDLAEAARDALKRADALDPADKFILELAVKNRLSRGQISRILKIPAGTVCRRLQRLTKRMNDPLVVALLNPHCPLPDEYRQLALEHFLQGRSFRELADKHQMRDHAVRRIIEHVKGWHRGVSWRGDGR